MFVSLVPEVKTGLSVFKLHVIDSNGNLGLLKVITKGNLRSTILNRQSFKIVLHYMYAYSYSKT